jgi:modulator of FtsH protease
MSMNDELKPAPVRVPGVVRRPEPREASVLATNKVLRNTYLLLSMTLLFSAGMAVLSMAAGAPALPWWATLIGMLGLLFAVHVTRNSAWGLFWVFAFTGFLGFMTGPIISAYLKFVPNGGQLVALSLGGTGVIFAGLSAYALTTRKDFSYMGGFLLAGLLILIIASIANIFLQITGLALALSVMAIGIFSALILFDTSRIIHGGEDNYISATVALYLNIYNIFLSLLQITGLMGGDD